MMGKKLMACVLAAMVFFGGFGFRTSAYTVPRPAGVYALDTGTAGQGGQEEEKPYWLLVVAVSFFIAVTTGVVVVLSYQKKVRQKTARENTEANQTVTSDTPEHGLVMKNIVEGDLPACADILCAVYNNELWQCSWAADTAEKYLRDYFEARKFVGFALKIDGVLCGAMFCHEKIWWNNSELFIDEMFIRPEYQRNGDGSMLLGEAKRYAEAHRLAGFTLTTNRYAPAADFYRKNGFMDCEPILYMGLEINAISPRAGASEES